uniref:Uncharacterized protein n=1 Tax=Trichuris muris TaxID=70415 RepID=A0A5S6R0N3_TRIMR
MDKLENGGTDMEESFRLVDEDRKRASHHDAIDLNPKGPGKTFFSRYGPSLRHLLPFRRGTSDLTARIDQAGCFSYATFGWVFTYLWSVFRNSAPADNEQWLISKHDSSNVNMMRLDHLWRTEVKLRGKDKRRPPSLVRVVLRFFRTRLLVSCICFLFCLTFGFIGPTCIVRSLLQYAQTPNSQKQKSTGLLFAFLMLLVELSRVISYGATWAVSTRTALRVRSALLALLFKKFMYQRATCETAICQITSIYANDSQRIFDAVSFLPLVLIGPLVLLGGIGYLLVLLGPISLVGVAVFLLFDVVQIFIGKTIVRLRKQAIVLTEKRIQAINEILISIRAIKMSALEIPFMRRVRDLRDGELKCLRKTGLAQSLAVSLGTVVPVLAAVSTFAIYIGVGYDLQPDQAFAAITVFFVMQFGIRMIPYGMRYLAEAFVSLRKIQAHLMVPEIIVTNKQPSDCSAALEVSNSTFCWPSNATSDRTESSSNAFVLHNINFKVLKGELVGLCGPVGCGKSSLLLAIVGDMVQTEGCTMVPGNIAYCPQEPWIFNASFRENILLGETFSRKSYSAVINVCSLKQDVKCFAAGDLTEIGEHGVNLSCGQKARLSLARALYTGKGLYLLDDILSPVDDQKETIILVTKNAQFLRQCDKVIFMSNGTIEAFGRHEDLLSESEAYSSFIDQVDEAAVHRNTTLDTFLSAESSEMPESSRRMTSSSSLSGNSNPEQNIEELLANIPLKDGHTMSSEENLCSETVSWSDYKSYTAAIGGLFSVAMLLLAFVLSTGSSIFSTAFLSYWLHFNHSEFDHSVGNKSAYGDHYKDLPGKPKVFHFLEIYLSSALLIVATNFLRSFVFVKTTIKAAERLHNALFDSIITANMQWFDTMSSGRIINRFSKDVDEVDTKIPFTLETLVQNFSTIAGYLIIISWTFPWFLVTALPLGCMFILFVACFRAGIRCLKRAENSTRSPLFSHIVACASGKSVLRTSGKTNDFIERMKHLLDQNSSWMFMYNSAMRWLAVWLDFLVVGVVFAISLLMVALGDDIEPAYAGMALSYAMQMSGIFQFAVRMQAELEAKMISVERMNRFIDTIEREDVHDTSCEIDKISDCVKGSISFDNVSLTYGKNISPALNNITFEVRDGCRLGILGRTGSGKTSLVNVLLRLYPISEGTVTIDNRNIDSIRLYDLRSRIAVIPQDPRLFSGSIRFNLDPQGTRSDAEIWKAVEFARLKTLVSKLPSGLESVIEEGGRNFSVGERQLIFLGRAFLQQARILLLDEATAYLDSTSVIDECLRALTNQRTVLIVAHRLSSIISCDRILIMDQGRAVEFGEKDALLSDPESLFSQLYKTFEESGRLEQRSFLNP